MCSPHASPYFLYFMGPYSTTCFIACILRWNRRLYRLDYRQLFGKGTQAPPGRGGSRDQTLSQSEIWYNNSKVVQKLAHFCIPRRVCYPSYMDRYVYFDFNFWNRLPLKYKYIFLSFLVDDEKTGNRHLDKPTQPTNSQISRWKDNLFLISLSI